MPILGHWYMLFLVVAFWGVIIGLVVWAIRSLRPSGDRSAGALSILVSTVLFLRAPKFKSALICCSASLFRMITTTLPPANSAA